MLARPASPHAMPAHRSVLSPPVLLVLLIGCAGFAAIWVLAAATLGRPCSWLAAVAALDAALLLRMGRARPGWARALAGVLATAVMIAAAQWGVIAAQVGAMFGLQPWESALKLGASLAWAIAGVSLDAVDLAWFGAALVVAAVVSR